MGEPISDDSSRKFPLGLKGAIAYLLLSGTWGLIWVLLQSWALPSDLSKALEGRELAEQIGYKIGYQFRTYGREILFSLAYVIAGLALVQKRAWGRTLSLWTLVIAVPFAAWTGATLMSGHFV